MHESHLYLYSVRHRSVSLTEFLKIMGGLQESWQVADFSRQLLTSYCTETECLRKSLWFLSSPRKVLEEIRP